MLDRITVRNFRNLKDVELKTPLITLLIGSNGSGKSGVFHALLVLKQTFLRDSRPDSCEYVGEIVNLGSRKEVVFGHNEDNVIQIGLQVGFNAGAPSGKIKSETGKFWYTAFSKKRYADGYEMIMNIDDLAVHKFKGGEREDGSGAIIEDTNEPFSTRNEHGLGFDLDLLNEEHRKYSHYCSTTGVKEFLDLVYSVPVPRGISQFKSAIPDRKSDRLASSSGLDDLTQNLLGMVAYDTDLVDQVSEFMNKLFGKKIRPSLIESGLGVSQRAGYRGTHAGTIDFYDPNIRSYATNTGFGLNQVLFLIAQVIDCPKGSVILIEEPEVSLHPVAQKQLSEILLYIAKSQQKQLIITTHSEHIAFALYDSISKKELTEDEIAVYNFSQTKDSVATKVERLETVEGSLYAFLGGDSDLIRRYIQALGKTDQYLADGTLG